MPKKIDSTVKAQTLRLLHAHRSHFPTLTAACVAVARHQGVGVETVRRWAAQIEIDEGLRPGMRSDEKELLLKLRNENSRLQEEISILRAASRYFSTDVRTPRSRVETFINDMRSKGFAVETTCRVLRNLDIKVSSRTYRSWKNRKPSTREIMDQKVLDSVAKLAWTIDSRGGRHLTRAGRYGRQRMLAAVRRMGVDATPGSVDRAMRKLGLPKGAKNSVDTPTQ
ncbi:MAG: hypothetical protein Q4D89_05680 [Arachnia propionica]|uniref:hypothetical protein n=1 Tax=Arachnia propionica TaxID=1750 RepID=UPI0026FB291F|nr:hypothetical protein [Arachnia propionica]